MRSELRIDLGALRRNVETLRRALEGAELWAVVKADAYGHGAADCSAAALGAGATAVCVATVGEALLAVTCRCTHHRSRPYSCRSARRRAARSSSSWDGVIRRCAGACQARHRHGRWGTTELPSPTREVVGVMTHLATVESDLTLLGSRSNASGRGRVAAWRHATRREQCRSTPLPESRFDAARCDALYGLSPFGTDPADDGPELFSRGEGDRLAKLLRAGESTGYGRRFIAAHETDRKVPVGYAGDTAAIHRRRAARRGERRRVIGTVSMDAVVVELDRSLPAGTPVTIVGEGVLSEHARFGK